ncbi:hypothetical protein PIB30_097688, partial [Stylosanthes scabra]|nr:hypothetical protein [Stylosanthes scabra]
QQPHVQQLHLLLSSLLSSTPYTPSHKHHPTLIHLRLIFSNNPYLTNFTLLSTLTHTPRTTTQTTPSSVLTS